MVGGGGLAILDAINRIGVFDSQFIHVKIKRNNLIDIKQVTVHYNKDSKEVVFRINFQNIFSHNNGMI